MLTTHSFCTECNYSPDTDHHVHLHARDPVSDESAYEMDERTRVEDLIDDEENPTEDDEEATESFKKFDELRKLKQLVSDGFLDPAELVDDYPEHFGENWYWDDEDEINYMEPVASEYDSDFYKDLDEWSDPAYQDFEDEEYPYEETDRDEIFERAAWQCFIKSCVN